MDELELKRAYEKLGLQEIATKDEVEKRYDILLRQDRAKRLRLNEEGAAEEGQTGFDEINRAYRLILQHEDRKAVESINKEKYGKYKKYADKAEKLDHFFSYYKWHLVGAIAAVLLIIYGFTSYMNHLEEQKRLAALPPVDLEASLIGLFFLPEDDYEMDAFEQALIAQFPGWKRVEASMLPLNMSNGNNPDPAMVQKAILQFAIENPDIYIMDADTFNWIAQNGVLLNLDAEAQDRFSAYGGAAMKARERTDDVTDDEAAAEAPEHVYGFNLSSSALAKELPIAYKDWVVGIRVNAKHPENALLLIERYLEAAK